MKRYCMDTSGFSNPLEGMPQDIHVRFWRTIMDKIGAGELAVTYEIYEELLHLPGDMGKCIEQNKDNLLLEVGQDGWDWNHYIARSTELSLKYQAHISENLNNLKNTVGINDMSIIALSKSLGLPIISMEKRTNMTSPIRRHIPDICDLESIRHLDFNDFLRLEGITN